MLKFFRALMSITTSLVDIPYKPTDKYYFFYD